MSPFEARVDVETPLYLCMPPGGGGIIERFSQASSKGWRFEVNPLGMMIWNETLLLTYYLLYGRLPRWCSSSPFVAVSAQKKLICLLDRTQIALVECP
jgi:hypothetical protein